MRLDDERGVVEARIAPEPTCGPSVAIMSMSPFFAWDKIRMYGAPSLVPEAG